MKRTRSQRRGFALMAVLWCVGLMTVAVLGLVSYVSLQLDENISLAKDERARDLALSGLAFGSHPQVKRNDPLLIGPGYQAVIDGENGRLNLNVLLAQARVDILERLWTQWGLKLEDAQALDDCLLDWVTPGDQKRLNGAKQPEYAKLGRPDAPPNRPFQSIEEIEGVIGFDKVVKLKPDWKNFFTLWSDGKLDLNEAPADLIAAFCNVSMEQAVSFVHLRDPDGKKGSPDGYHWQSLDEASSYLGMTASDFTLAAPLLTLQSTVWRIESTGTVGNHHHTVSVVMPRSGSNPVYSVWREF